MPTMGKLIIICLTFAAIQLISAKFPFYNVKPFMHRSLRHDPGDPLILTSFIEKNQTQQARDAAEVHFDAFQNVTSYSGYFTVDKENNGNQFFWFFPSADNYTNDPVLLWLTGGPGITSLFGLFAEHGPFEVKNGSVVLREYSWHKKFSMLYIDQPVGTGYSFTDGELVNNQTQVGEQLYSALIQFFTIFSELQSNEFFVTGESYAGKFVPTISYTIHQKNPTAALKINLKGLVTGNGWSDPINQLNYGDFMYQLGYIDLATMNIANQQRDYIISQINARNYEEAADGWNELLDIVYYNVTGLDNICNFIEDFDNSPVEWQDFIVRDDVREAIHVGNQLFTYDSADVHAALKSDLTQSVAPWISELLSYYRVLIFSGQVDILVGYVLTENYLLHLNFDSADEYKNSTRQVWYVDNKVAGYVKTAGNLTEATVRNAGHMAPMDQPAFVFNLILRFVANTTIART